HRHARHLPSFPTRRSSDLEKMPFFLLTAVWSLVTYAAQRNAGAVAALESVPLQYRFENALLAYNRYLRKTFWPADLAIFYPISKDRKSTRLNSSHVSISYA